VEIALPVEVEIRAPVPSYHSRMTARLASPSANAVWSMKQLAVTALPGAMSCLVAETIVPTPAAKYSADLTPVNARLALISQPASFDQPLSPL
jgi:hypothetical protein